MSKLKIGILGSNGFVGRALSTKISSNFSDVFLYLFSRSNRNEINKKDNIENISFELKFDTKEIPKELFEIEILYYLISETIPLSSWEEPSKEITTNIFPIINLVEKLSKKGKLKKIIFTSSAGTIYGSSLQKNKEESAKSPHSPYGISKLTIEYFLEFFRIKNDISYEIYRMSNVYGPGQKTEKGLGLINTILEEHILGKEITIFGNGKNIRNYIYIEDVVKILAHSIKNPLSDSFILNLASNDNLSINDIIEKIEFAIQQKLKINNLNARNSDNPHVLIDNSKLTERYKDLIPTPLEIGISETYLYLLNRKIQ